MVLMLSLSPVFAIIGQPHWFYGDVLVNGEPAIDGITIDVKVSGETVASTTTSEGQYGQDAMFYVEDPYGDMAGKTLKFYLDGVYVADYTFENFGYTELDFSISTTCGNDVCEPGEDSTNCCDDCGCPSGYGCIDNSCQPVCGDAICQPEENSDTCCTDCGCASGYYCSENTCVVSGGGGGGGGSPVPPSSPSEPYCGDDTCDTGEGENCETCPEDCGDCPPECVEDSDCDDADACTVDACLVEGTCQYVSIEACQNGDGCCPSGCDLTNDNDCSCVDECTVPKCEDGYIYDCVQDANGCMKWQQTQYCIEGCCGAECCEGEVVILETSGGFTGAAIAAISTGMVAFLPLLAIIVGVLTYMMYRRSKNKSTKKSTKKK